MHIKKQAGRDNISYMTENVDNKNKETRKKGRMPNAGIYGDALLAAAEKLSGSLLNDQQIAECLNISMGTFYRWRNENEEFAQALIRGRAKRLEKLSDLAIAKAESDNNMLTFLLKSKGKYIEHHHSENISVKREELALKEKALNLSSEKFISELCETHNLNKEETLDLLKKHISPTAKEIDAIDDSK